MNLISEVVPPSVTPTRAAVLLEFSWEVCNQVGGIYQVLKSKAELMLQTWDQRYCLVGPAIRN